jgi:hypothetical protein
VSIPYGQRFIYLELAAADEILQHLGADSTLDAPGSNPCPTPDVLTAELYINNIFVNPEIHDIFIKRIGFSLIRVHRRQVSRVNKSEDNILMQQLKWPIETIYLGLRPAENISRTTTKMLDSWHIYAQTTTVDVELNSLGNGYSFTGLPASAITADDFTAGFVSFSNLAVNFATTLSVAGTTVLTMDQLNAALQLNAYPLMTGLAGSVTPTSAQVESALPPVYAPATFQECTATITQLNVEAHGVPLYRDTPSAFFNSYIPNHYGGQYIRTPDDCGALMITFNLYPGSYQPSGHVNISRAREFYIKYTSSFCDSTHPCDLVAVAVALNFLLISDGSAVLTASTG